MTRQPGVVAGMLSEQQQRSSFKKKQHKEVLVSEAKKVLQQAIDHWTAAIAMHGPLSTPTMSSTRRPVARRSRGWST
jgi:hypothetical protein